MNKALTLIHDFNRCFKLGKSWLKWIVPFSLSRFWHFPIYQYSLGVATFWMSRLRLKHSRSVITFSVFMLSKFYKVENIFSFKTGSCLIFESNQEHRFFMYLFLSFVWKGPLGNCSVEQLILSYISLTRWNMIATETSSCLAFEMTDMPLSPSSCCMKISSGYCTLITSHFCEDRGYIHVWKYRSKRSTT